MVNQELENIWFSLDSIAKVYIYYDKSLFSIYNQEN